MKKQILFRPLVVAILAFGLGQTSLAQKAGIHGRITDSTGAVIVGAEVLVTTVDTGIKRKAVSSEEGYYTVDLLQRGKYQISVQMQGFKPIVRSGIALDVHQVARIDFTMEVGELTQKIEVDANASPLNFENAEIKHAIPARALEDLPLQLAGGQRNVVRFALLLPGVSTGGGNNAFDARINGGQQMGDEAMLDGVSMQQGVTGNGMLSLIDSLTQTPEQVSEVSVLTSNYEPQYGSTSAAVITMVTRSGTKEFHGEAHEFHRNSVLNARQFGVDTKSLNIENEFGASIGGPAKIPLLWGGERKTFFYISYNAWVPRGGTVASFLSFPTLQQRQGDFRDWVGADGKLIPIYDPDTTRPNPAYDPNLPLTPANGPFLRDQFMGCNGQTPNVICSSDPRLQNSLAKQWFQFLPPPNRPGLTDNFQAPAQPGFGVNYQNSLALRFDHHFSEKDHFALHLRYNDEVRAVDTSYPPELSPQKLTAGTEIWAPRLNWDHIFSPTLVNNINFGYMNFPGSEACVSQPFANEFPKIPGLQPGVGTPALAFEDFSSLSCNGGLSYAGRPTYIVNDLLTWVRGKHTLKFGGEYRALGQDEVRIPSLGEFGFNRLNTGLVGTTPSGSAIASFLLEQVNSAEFAYQANTTVQQRVKYYTAHAGDTWKATPNLTFNFGLRWDLSLPAVDKFNRSTFLDPLGANPGAGGRPGRLAFAGTEYGAASFGRDHPEFTWYKAFAPRVGLAYRVNDKTVVRTGYGIFYTQSFYPGWSGGNSQQGFNLFGNFSSPDGGLTRSFILSEGIPQTFTPPPFIDSTYLNGQSGPLYRPLDANRLPYSQQWNLTLERELTNDFYISTAYVGNKGTRLWSSTAPINALDPRLLSRGEALFDQFQPGQTELNGVPVPYPGWIEQMSACAPTVAQALLPFPQYCGRLQGINENAGNSTYHSFQFKAEKRMARGTWLLASYTLSKLLTDSENIHTPALGWLGTVGQISPFERHRNKSLSTDDVPQTLSLAFVYELPFGSGKRFLSQAGPVNKLLGGWQVSSVFKASAGVPFFFRSGACRLPQGAFAASCIPAVLPGADPFLQDPGNFDPGKGRLFDLAAFEGPTFNFAFGHGPRVSNLRAQGFHNHDFTLTKNTYITERVGIQFRAEFFNLWNWHMFSSGAFGGGAGAFDTYVDSPDFGKWNGSVTPPRNIQFGLKVVF